MALIGSGSGPGPLKPDADKNAISNTVFAITVATVLFQNSTIPDDGFSYVLPDTHQYVVFGLATLSGSLTLNGDMVVFE